MEADSTLQPVQEKAESPESADLVVGVLAEFDSDSLEGMHAALRSLRGPLRIALLSDAKKDGPPLGDLETAEEGAAPEISPSPSMFHLPLLLTRPDNTATGMSSTWAAYQSVFMATERLQARGCCILA